MSQVEAISIIKSENIRNINWFNENNLKENQVVISKNTHEWIVYVTDERASVVLSSISVYKSEETALDALIQKARYGKKYLT
jgi:hypothetical protein